MEEKEKNDSDNTREKSSAAHFKYTHTWYNSAYSAANRATLVIRLGAGYLPFYNGRILMVTLPHLYTKTSFTHLTG